MGRKDIVYVRSQPIDRSSQERLQKNENKLKGVSEFKKMLNHSSDHNIKNHGVKISQHAAKRLDERKINVDTQEFMKIREGLDKLKEKGGRDSLVITQHGAYIMDVDKQTMVTAIDKNDMADNVFTKIDSTIFIN